MMSGEDWLFALLIGLWLGYCFQLAKLAYLLWREGRKPKCVAIINW